LVSEQKQTSWFQILILDILFFLICKFEYWMHNEYIIANDNDKLLETNLIRNVIFQFLLSAVPFAAFSSRRTRTGITCRGTSWTSWEKSLTPCLTRHNAPSANIPQTR
jgi:hypothetical protein